MSYVVEMKRAGVGGGRRGGAEVTGEGRERAAVRFNMDLRL